MFQSKSHATSVPWCRNNPEFFLPKAPYMLEILQFTYLLQWLSFIHQLRGAEPNPIEARPKHFRNFNQGNWSLFYSWWCALIKQYRAMMISCTNCVSAWLFKNFGCVFKLIVQRNASKSILLYIHRYLGIQNPKLFLLNFGLLYFPSMNALELVST